MYFTNVSLYAGTTPIQDLVSGLTSDGVFAKLDRLWVFAQATEALALVDLIVSASATAVNSPTFTANRGYTGNGSTQYIDSNVTDTTTGLQYARDSACIFGWNNTAGQEAVPFFGVDHVGIDVTTAYPEFTDGNAYFDVNDSGSQNAGAWDGRTGLYLMNRTASNSQTYDANGAQIGTSVAASVALSGDKFVFLKGRELLSSRQICCGGFGGGLTAGDRTNLYTRLRTYMTAVGVP